MTDTDDTLGRADAAAAAEATPSLQEAVGELGKASREGLDAGLDALRALRRLFFADLALARAALARAMVWMMVAVAFGAAAWLMLMAACIAALRYFGLSWLESTSLTAGISLVVTGIGAWQTIRYFEMSKLDATRRQLARLGIGGDDDTEPSAREETP